MADRKKVVVGANADGVKIAVAANSQLVTSTPAVAGIGKTAVACPMVVRRIRVRSVDIGHSGIEQGTVRCLAQRAVALTRGN